MELSEILRGLMEPMSGGAGDNKNPLATTGWAVNKEQLNQGMGELQSSFNPHNY